MYYSIGCRFGGEKRIRDDVGWKAEYFGDLFMNCSKFSEIVFPSGVSWLRSSLRSSFARKTMRKSFANLFVSLNQGGSDSRTRCVAWNGLSLTGTSPNISVKWSCATQQSSTRISSSWIPNEDNCLVKGRVLPLNYTRKEETLKFYQFGAHWGRFNDSSIFARKPPYLHPGDAT